MKIAIVAPLVAAIRPGSASGVQTVISDLALGLAERGHEVAVHAPAGSSVRGARVWPVDARSLGSARLRPLAGTRSPGGDMEAAFARAVLDAERGGAEAVSQHAFDPEALLAGWSAPAVHTLHAPPVLPATVAAAVLSQGRLASVSTATAGAWRAATGREVLVLRNGVRPFPLPPTPVEPVALIAGRISPEKGTAEAIAAARSAGLRPLVAGPVYDAAYHRSEVAPLLRPGERVGPVTRGRLRRLMAAAAVTLMPVRWEEPFGLVAAESQMAGCPVVAYRRGGLPEVVEDGMGGILVQPEDREGFVDAIGRACRLDRRQVRASAEGRFAIEAFVESYERELRR